MIEKAIENLNSNIDAQINVLSTGRSISVNASGFVDLIKARDILLSMQSKKKEDTFTCEHCNTTDLNKAMYGRWHGDKCKKK